MVDFEFSAVQVGNGKHEFDHTLPQIGATSSFVRTYDKNKHSLRSLWLGWWLVPVKPKASGARYEVFFHQR